MEFEEFEELEDSKWFCRLLGYDTEPEVVIDEKTGKPKRLYPAGMQMVWKITREPARFGLPPGAVVRVGSSIRFRPHLVRKWLDGGGTKQKPRKVVSTNGREERSAAA